MKKSKSLKFKLVLTMFISFFTFVLVLGSVSFALYYNNVYQISNKKTETSNIQTLVNFENYFDDAIRTSNSIQSKAENTDIYNENRDVKDFLDSLVFLKNNVKSIALYDSENGDVIVSSTKSIIVNDPLNDVWFTTAKENPLIDIFSGVEISDEGDYAFTLSKLITYNKSIKSAILKIDFDFTDMVRLINKSNLGNGGHVTIYDNNYNVVFCSQKYSNAELEYIQDLVLGTELIDLNQTKYNLFVSTISKTSWKVAIFTNFTDVTEVLNTFLIIIISSAIAIVLIFTILILIVAEQIVSPIRLLQLEMAKVASLSENIEDTKLIHGSLEVENLNKSFNKMMARIKELAQKLLVEENNKRESELKALQNQINPHFLYNTLDSIVYLIDSDEKEKATEMIIALSKFFRISISKGKNIIPFSKEIEHVQNYLLIQKIRFGKQFDYTIDVDPKINDIPVIKLILQPIVENSIIHGFNELEYVGRIDIIARIEGDLIRIDLKDNGYGILPEKIEQIYKSFKDPSTQDGVGFKNVYQRLKIYYGDKADIKIISDLDIGTDVIIYIPLKGGKQNEKD